MSGLTLSSSGATARVVFDRPEALNALTPDALRQLVHACEELGRDEGIKVVRFEGAGGCFSAGADLPAFLSELGGSDPHAVADLGRLATDAVAGLPQISIAAIQGHCVGAGVVLAAACDVRIAADDARFLIPELDAGIPLGWGGMAYLARLVGATLAADVVLTCRPFGAEEALRAGFVSRVVPVGELQTALDELEASIGAKSANVLRATKQQLRDIRNESFDARKDADALLAALRDPESARQGMEYISRRIRKLQGASR